MEDKIIFPSYSNKNFEISYTRPHKAISMSGNHYHDNYEIYYLLSGERYYFIKDRTYHIKKGDIVLINMYDMHRTINFKTEVYERILINFKTKFLSEFIKSISDIDILSPFKENIHVLKLDIKQQAFIETLLLNMFSESNKKAIGFETYIKIMLLELLININRYHLQSSDKKIEYPSSIHRRISEIVKYINNNYNKNLSLEHISEMFYISPYYFSRIFKEVTGFNFIEYLNAIRIKESQKLLRDTRLNITQISEEVGYQSVTHYGRVFKQITGISPSYYKKMLKINQ